ncbi:MAG TPA: B12-binding domain-containing radical SAM protein [Polyangia bacterium]|jgi:radical SAM superfamily enzyme YgiQ (UPF0313 family)
MRVLLVYPSYPVTYWGAEHTRQFTKKRGFLPPLGLITVAALLPQHWELRLCDMNLGPLEDAQLDWADAVFVTGMLVQREGLHEVARRARQHGAMVVAGGPYATARPDLVQPDVDCVVVGEAEDLMDTLAAALEQGPAALPRRLEAPARPAMARSPLPRYDLLDLDAYLTLGVQFSRGCPFHCEFCDIIELFGRVPRLKSVAQLLGELDAVYALGFRGSIFLVDDNFIGNKTEVRRLLAPLTAWMQAHDYPFDFFTEASVNLAEDVPLIDAMVEAGFSMVFLGIETPSEEALRAAHKLQNVRRPLDEAVTIIVQRGLEVQAGFIVGFDSDDRDTVERQRAWIARSPIPLAMTGVLMALPGTQLERRLAAEGRLCQESSGDNFMGTNFRTRIDELDLLEGYERLLADIYAPAAYFERVARALALCPTEHLRFRRPPLYAWGCGLRSLWYQGVRGTYRGAYWRFLGRVLRDTPGRFTRAVGLAIHGHHMIRYTAEDVLPRLRTAIAALRARRAAAAAEARAAA